MTGNANTTDVLLDAARRTFAADRYATEATGIDIAAVGDHSAECHMAVDSRHLNARGVVMGGALFTLADLAAAVAANTDCLTADEPLAWVSLDATIHYLAPAAGSTLESRCTALKHGRTTALYQTVVTCGNRQVAIVETTMVHV